MDVKGLGLAELFFERFGLPALREHFSHVADRTAAGYIDRGSEALGADDEFSRDHGWGPTFNLYMEKGDFEAVGTEIESRLNELKPKVFEGFDLSKLRTDPIKVMTVEGCFRRLTGRAAPPRTARGWAKIDDNGFCFAQAGRIFRDPLGKLTGRKRAFERAYYPDSVWRLRIARTLYAVWHYGSYNLCGRLTRRGDGTAVLIGQGHFVKASIQLTFLLNRRFAPYWKWLHWAFLRLPYLVDEMEVLFVRLESASDVENRSSTIGNICQLIRRTLCEQGLLPDDKWRNFMGAYEIADTIREPEIRKMMV